MNNNYTDYLAHHGVKGMRWGVRRYQPYDTTYNPTAVSTKNRIMRTKGIGDYVSSPPNKIADVYSKHVENSYNKTHPRSSKKDSLSVRGNAYDRADSKFPVSKQKEIAKKVAIGSAIVGGTVLAAYGGTKFIRNKNIEIATRKGEEAARRYFKENKITLKYNSVPGYNYKTNLRAFQNGKVLEGYVGRTSNGKYSIWDVRRAANRAFKDNDLARYGAKGVRDAHIEIAKEEKLREAAKNVYKYYRGK